LKRYYAGIGSRQTPPDVMDLVHRLAATLAATHTLRSGAANGADTGFESGANAAGGPADVYLAWKGFNGSLSALYGVTAEALEMASTVHPAWERLSEGPKKLHARNCYQVMGPDLATPAEFVACWTPDGCESVKTRNSKTGGTASAIVLAERNKIPVFNLKNPASRNTLVKFLKFKDIDVSWLDALIVEHPKQETLF
jgi:hypothetical protein